jgi:hypothetical protein
MDAAPLALGLPARLFLSRPPCPVLRAPRKLARAAQDRTRGAARERSVSDARRVDGRLVCPRKSCADRTGTAVYQDIVHGG